MECKGEILKFTDALEEYISGRIDDNTLYDQMTKLFYEFLKEERFRKLEYLKIYPFISALQDEDIYQEQLLKKEIAQIIDILDGKKSFSYGLWMKLEERDIGQIHKIWDGYKMNGAIDFEEADFLQKELQNLVFHTKTIEDLCLERLLAMLVDLPIISAQDDRYNLLYTSDRIDEMSISENVEKLMKLLTGKSSVHILLKYGCSDCMYMIL